MSDHVMGSVWLVGAGGMAVEYAKVLMALGITPVVIGRGQASAVAFEEKTGLPVVAGGLQRFLRKAPAAPAAVVIAVNVVELAQTAALLLDYCQPKVLLEKPGVLSVRDLRLLQTSKGNAELFIAYNRRYFSSAQAVRRMLEDDGGPVSCTFEFTEWAHRIEPILHRKDPGEMARWFLSNSSHVVDLAFHFAGEPRTLHPTVSGALTWHPSGSAFCGSGVTMRNVMFSYHANWNAPGRWWVEVMSSSRRYRMCPMESLQVQEKGSLSWSEVPLSDERDRLFKPGLHDMVADFLSGTPSPVLCRFAEQTRLFNVYRRIAGYAD